MVCLAIGIILIATRVSPVDAGVLIASMPDSPINATLLAIVFPGVICGGMLAGTVGMHSAFLEAFSALLSQLVIYAFSQTYAGERRFAGSEPPSTSVRPGLSLRDESDR